MCSTYITPELPAWCARGLVSVVVVGDVALAMRSSLGQGASQGLEIVQVLSMLPALYLERRCCSSVSRLGYRSLRTSMRLLTKRAKGIADFGPTEPNLQQIL